MPNGVNVNVDYETLSSASANIKRYSTEEISNLSSEFDTKIISLESLWVGEAADQFKALVSEVASRLFKETQEFGVIYAEAMDEVVEGLKAQEEATQARNNSDLSGT